MSILLLFFSLANIFFFMETYQQTAVRARIVNYFRQFIFHRLHSISAYYLPHRPHHYFNT